MVRMYFWNYSSKALEGIPFASYDVIPRYVGLKNNYPLLFLEKTGL